MRDVSGTLFFHPDADAINDLPPEWRRLGKRPAHKHSVAAEFAARRMVDAGRVLHEAIGSLPPDGTVRFAVWLPSAARSEGVSLEFRPGDGAVARIDSIWVEVDPDESVVGMDEVRIFDVTDSAEARLIDGIVTSDAAMRQPWFNEVLASGPRGQRLRVDLCSRGGIVGVVFDRNLLAELSAREVHIRVRAIDAIGHAVGEWPNGGAWMRSDGETS